MYSISTKTILACYNEAMKQILISLLFLNTLWINHVWAESIRVEVYPISQQYWDVKEGETLSGIAAKLLPNNPDMQQTLMDAIFRMNPKAFINNDKHQLLSKTRIWLPSQMKRADSVVDRNKYDVQTFSWGNVKKPK